jgi:hypothetical protein
VARLSHPASYQLGPNTGLLVDQEGGVLKFRQAVDDAKPQVLAQLDLHHLGRELLAHLANFLSSELHLPTASFDQIIDKQGGEELRFFVTGMTAQV